MSMFNKLIIKSLKESIILQERIIDSLIKEISNAAQRIILAIEENNKILIFGNGGSAADAQHFAAELIGRFKKNRNPLPAIALTTDTSILTSIGNDYGFSDIFSRQVEGLAKVKDVLIGISTSGNSINVLKAIKKGKEIGCFSIALLGKDGGIIKEVTDLAIIVPSYDTPRIQEAHITIIHIICDLIEHNLFRNESV